jgi:hypothetical protein
MTDKQREAARNNGAKSNGPITTEGKARSSQNACRHQLTADRLVLNTEEQAEFDRMFAAYREQLQPRNEIETDLIEQMAAAKWRERRCWQLQKSLLEYNVSSLEHWFKKNQDDPERLACALDKDGNTRGFQLLQRYESMHTRTWRRSWRDLLENQKFQNEPGKGLNPVDSPTPVGENRPGQPSESPREPVSPSVLS